MKTKIGLLCMFLIMNVTNFILADNSKDSGNYTIEIERKEHKVPGPFSIEYQLSLKPNPDVRSEYSGGSDTATYQNTGLDSRLIVTRDYGGKREQIFNETVWELLHNSMQSSKYVIKSIGDVVVGTVYSSAYKIKIAVRLVHLKEGNPLIMIRIIDLETEL